MSEPGGRTTLHTLLGDYPHTRALRMGALRSDLVEFAFADIAPANRGFKPLVREHAFDLGELAIVTYLQAKAQGAPYVLIPATVLGRGQLHTIAYDPARGRLWTILPAGGSACAPTARPPACGCAACWRSSTASIPLASAG